MTFRRVARKPVYLQIANQLRMSILNGDLRPGAPLPSERELTEAFAAVRTTVREAFRPLPARRRS